VERLEKAAISYHEQPAALDEVREALSRAAAAPDARAETLIALARASFIWGDVRAKTDTDKLDAYERGRQAARRALEAMPRSAAAHFWYATNTARWGQVKGVMRSLFLLPEVQRGIDTVLELDPVFPGVYALAGNVFYELPAMFGGDLGKAETMFRKGLALDPHFTGMRVGLAKTLIRRGRTAEARRELEAVLAETTPTNPAEWIVKDVPDARRLLSSVKDAR